MTPTSFSSWARHQLSGAPVQEAIGESPKNVSEIAEGHRIFVNSPCTTCHTIAGISSGTIAPNLTHFGSRTSLAGATFDNTPENLAKWIKDPPALKPGAKMPALGVRGDQLPRPRRLPVESQIGTRYGCNNRKRSEQAPGCQLPPYRSAVGLAGNRWDHKRAAMMYGLSALVLMALGGLEAMLIRTQLAFPNGTFLSAQVYNEIFTMHGTTMIFLVVLMPSGDRDFSRTSSSRCRSARATSLSRGSMP